MSRALVVDCRPARAAPLPHIYQAPLDANAQGCSTWMGMFGGSSTSKLFAGWDIRVMRRNRQLEYGYEVWSQWSPGSRHTLTNLDGTEDQAIPSILSDTMLRIAYAGP